MAKKLGSEPAFPIEYDIIEEDEKGPYHAHKVFIGISKRQLLAGMAMQGFLSNANLKFRDDNGMLFDTLNPIVLSKLALKFTDELLKQEHDTQST